MSMTRAHRGTDEQVLAAKARRRELARRVAREDRRFLDKLAPYDGPVVQADAATRSASASVGRGRH